MRISIDHWRFIRTGITCISPRKSVFELVLIFYGWDNLEHQQRQQ